MKNKSSISLCLKWTNIFKQHISVVEIICKLLVNKYKYK